MPLILKAIKFIELKHAGQTRKVSGDPYITHPIAVSYIVAAYKQSKHLNEILVACLLHDTLEDTDATFEEIAREFTPLVASLVLELSNDEKEIARIGKLEYQKKKLLGISSYALLIKLADRLHNVSDHPSRKMLTDTLELIGHLMDRKILTRPQKKLAFDIAGVCNKALEMYVESKSDEESVFKN